MKQEINPHETPRAHAYELWIHSPMPMVTLTKTFNVTPMVRLSKCRPMRFNMLLAWCVGRAASRMEEMYFVVEKERMYQYDKLAINVIVPNSNGGINSCDIPFSESLHCFADDYELLTRSAAERCESSFLDDAMVVGTSAMVQTELDSIVNQYTDLFSNPMVMWGRYRKHGWHYSLPVSFQFHHVLMDGMHAACFLENLQQEIKNLKFKNR